MRLGRARSSIGVLAAGAALSSLLFALGAGGEDRGRDLCEALQFQPSAQTSGIEFVHDRGNRGEKHYPETMGSGVAWLDYDGDGWTDLYLVQSGAFPPGGGHDATNRLFRNRGDGTFEDVTPGSGAGDRGYGQGVTAADIDGDGWTDLYLTNFGADTLLHNRGDGTFDNQTAASGLGLGGWSSSAALADGDGDGDLDLYVTRYLVYEGAEQIFCGDPETGIRHYCDPALFRGETDRYYRNRGDGTFTDATLEAGLNSANGKGLGVLFTDIDGDSSPDLYIANDLTLNLLFQNHGDGTFTDISLFSGTALNREGKPEAGMGLASGDVDRDGRPDLVVTNFDVETNTLYRNLGDGLFEDVAAPADFGPPSFNSLAFGVVLSDLDLDGDLDAYVANGHVREHPRRENVSYEEVDLVLLNDGTGRFSSLACPWLTENPAVGRGLAAGDLDNDGDPDLALQHSGGPFALLRNAHPKRPWLGLRLRGQAPNSAAIGARATLSSSGLSGVEHQQHLWPKAGDSYQSTSDPRLVFGLPDAETATRLEITWPSQKVLRILDPPSGRYLTLHESELR